MHVRTKKIAAGILCGAMAIGAVAGLASCSGGDSSSNNTVSGNSATSSSSQSASSQAPAATAATVIDTGYYRLSLPAGLTPSESKADTYEDADGNTVNIAVHSSTAEDVIGATLLDPDLAETGAAYANGFEYVVIANDNEKRPKTYYIAPFETGCVEVTSKGVDDAVVEELLSGLEFMPNAFNIWQDSVQS